MEPEDSVIPAANPHAIFADWLTQAEDTEPNDANAMALATATPGGVPSVRMVLLKGHDRGGDGPDGRGGFTFYTNANSRKGEEIRANAQCALLFHWKSLRRQIRIEGALTQVTPDVADEYFHSRSRQSQIGAAASQQSRPLDSRQTYLDRCAALETEYGEGPIPRPPHWTGFTLSPAAFEFWQDRPGRMHDRRRFTWGDAGWTDSLLYP